jgi:hypothetical protein
MNMGKKIFVDGGICINTQYFTCVNIGAGYGKMEDAEILMPKTFLDGERCLIIDDEHPQSMFNEYYARSFVVSSYIGAELITKDYSLCFLELQKGLNDIKRIAEVDLPIIAELKSSLRRMLYINAITILDSFICSIIIARIIRNENAFIGYYKKLISNNVKMKLEKYLFQEERGKWEMEIIKEIMHTSYENMDRIKESFKAMDLSCPQDKRGVMSAHFRNRNLFVHRNGKTKNGTIMEVDNIKMKAVVNDVENFAIQIMEIVNDM